MKRKQKLKQIFSETIDGGQIRVNCVIYEPTGDVVLKVEFKDYTIMYCNVFELETVTSPVENICSVCETKRLKLCAGCF